MSFRQMVELQTLASTCTLLLLLCANMSATDSAQSKGVLNDVPPASFAVGSMLVQLAETTQQMP